MQSYQIGQNYSGNGVNDKITNITRQDEEMKESCRDINNAQTQPQSHSQTPIPITNTHTPHTTSLIDQRVLRFLPNRFKYFFIGYHSSPERDWNEPKSKHCCGKSLEKNVCESGCKCPIPGDEFEVREHEQERCFKILWEKGIYQLLAAIGDGDEFNINEIFEAFRNRS
uniref:Uncharacterized protein n=1 Tax=Panagrolaimus superbus TaxID=310955 RepID=A0A914XXI4_9BILA